MKKFLVLFFLLPLWAGVDLTLSGNLFLPKASYYKDAYGSTIFNFSLEGEYRIIPSVGAFLGMDYLHKGGKLTYSAEPLTLTVVPVSAGVRFHFSSAFVDAGVGSWNYSEKAEFASASGSLTGFFLGAGFRYTFTKFYLRFRAEYSMAKKKVEELESDLGGLQLEAGVGISL